MGAQHGPIDCPSMGHGKNVGGPSMDHRIPIDGLPWDPNSGLLRCSREKSIFLALYAKHYEIML